MGDGQECQICRRSRRNCECKAPFQVVGTWVDGKLEAANAYSRSDVDELCEWFREREKSDGVYVNRYVDGIGYVLDEVA
jgi:hypothetical protein